jgi:hypothetical protein
MAAKPTPCISSRDIASAAIPHRTGSTRQHTTVARERDGSIIELNRVRPHEGQMSFGKLTLLSADCLGSGTMIGSSRMVADSSGTCGAPGAGGLALGVADLAGGTGVVADAGMVAGASEEAGANEERCAPEAAGGVTGPGCAAFAGVV